MAKFRHKTVRRFKVGKFIFKNGILTIPDDNPEDIELFEKYVEQLPKREQLQIVQLDEEAQARLERNVGEKRETAGKGKESTHDPVLGPAGSSVVKGAMQSKDILTAKDRQQINEQQDKSATQPTGANALVPPTKK